MADEKAIDFYKGDARWDSITEDLSKVYLDTFFADETAYDTAPLNAGDTVRYADRRDEQLYHVLMARRDGKVLLADANNIHLWATTGDLEKAVDTAAEAPQYSKDNVPMGGGSSYSVEIQYNWKKAAQELPVKVGDNVLVHSSGLTGRVIGTIAADRTAKVAYYDPFGQVHVSWYDVDNLTRHGTLYEDQHPITPELYGGAIEKVSHVIRSDISYEAERMRLEGASDDDILYELSDAFGIGEESIKEIMGGE